MPTSPAPHFTHLLFIHAPTSSPNSSLEQMVCSDAYEEAFLIHGGTQSPPPASSELAGRHPFPECDPYVGGAGKEPAFALDFGRTWWQRRESAGVDSESYLNEVRNWRDIWKPEHIRFLLIAESHVAERVGDASVFVNVDTTAMPFLSCVLPKSYVRLIYCLGYGDNSICNPAPKPNKPTRFWEIFEALAAGDPLVSTAPPLAPPCERRARVLEVLRRRGIWLVDASVIPLYAPGGWRTFPNQMAKQILYESFITFVAPTFAQHAIEKVWIIGESVAAALKKTGFVGTAKVCPQPTRGNAQAFKTSLDRMKADIIESL